MRPVPSRPLFLALVAASLGSAAPAAAAQVSRAEFGRLADGTRVDAITLANRGGMTVTVITFGAALQSVVLTGDDGKRTDVLLGHATLDEYLAKRLFMGATVGRVANRIAGGRFTLDGKTYQTTRNDGNNALHGGDVGFDMINWDVAETRADADGAEVTLHHVSPDGDQGYPGRLEVWVRYSLDARNALTISYRATTDRPTVVALSNHAYWNLAGEGSPHGALDQRLTIPADSYLPVDAELIPTGEIRSVSGTPFDFRQPTAIGERVRTASDAQIRIGRGYDHNWIVTRARTDHPHLMARLADPRSRRWLEIWSDQPGLQFYSGNFLDGTTSGKSGRSYRQGDAVALEPQAFPDTVNHPAFGSIRLDPGAVYTSTIIYRFGEG
jgi:aldose 1-epimerase